MQNAVTTYRRVCHCGFAEALLAFKLLVMSMLACFAEAPWLHHGCEEKQLLTHT